MGVTRKMMMAVGVLGTAGLLSAAQSVEPVAAHPPAVAAWLDVLGHDPVVQAAIEGQDQALLTEALDDLWEAMSPAVQENLGPPPIVLARPVGSEDDLAALLQSFPPEFLQARGIDQRVLTPEMLRASQIPDAAERRAAMVDALSSLPEDLRARFAGGFNDATSAATDDTQRGEATPLIEAWHSLSPMEQEALRDHEHLIGADDERALIQAMRTMRAEASKAALALVSLSAADPDAEAALLDHDRELAAEAAARGFYRNPTHVPPPEALLTRIRQARLAGAANADGFRALEQQLPLYSSYMIPAAAEAYERVGPADVAKVFSNSIYGAPIMVRQYPVDEVSFDNPTLTIGGREAALDWVQYAGGDWGTVLTAFDGQVVHVFEVATRLEGSQRDDFVRFASEVVTQSAGMEFGVETLTRPATEAQ